MAWRPAARPLPLLGGSTVVAVAAVSSWSSARRKRRYIVATSPGRGERSSSSPFRSRRLPPTSACGGWLLPTGCHTATSMMLAATSLPPMGPTCGPQGHPVGATRSAGSSSSGLTLTPQYNVTTVPSSSRHRTAATAGATSGGLVPSSNTPRSSGASCVQCVPTEDSIRQEDTVAATAGVRRAIALYAAWNACCEHHGNSPSSAYFFSFATTESQSGNGIETATTRLYRRTLITTSNRAAVVVSVMSGFLQRRPPSDAPSERDTAAEPLVAVQGATPLCRVAVSSNAAGGDVSASSGSSRGLLGS